MATLKIDPSTGDLALTNNSLGIERDISEETKQRLTSKFRTFLGEWFLDSSVGVPYFEYILVKNPNLSQVKQIFREIVLSDEQVDKLETPIVLTLDRSTRGMSLSFSALLNDGTYLSFAESILKENR